MKRFKHLIGNRETVIFLVAGVVIAGVAAVFISMIGELTVRFLKYFINLFV